MYKYYRQIDEQALLDIQKYENHQFSRFKEEIDAQCLSISKKLNCNYTVCLHRWVDSTFKWKRKQLDGYTAMVQIDFKDTNGDIIVIDESGCSFFENLTFISFNPLSRKYRVFQNEKLSDIREEVNQLMNQCNI